MLLVTCHFVSDMGKINDWKLITNIWTGNNNNK